MDLRQTPEAIRKLSERRRLLLEESRAEEERGNLERSRKLWDEAMSLPMPRRRGRPPSEP